MSPPIAPPRKPEDFCSGSSSYVRHGDSVGALGVELATILIPISVVMLLLPAVFAASVLSLYVIAIIIVIFRMAALFAMPVLLGLI